MKPNISANKTGGSTNDHVLMTSTACGDQEAFSLLVGRHLRTMTAVAHRILGNAAEADEVVQEAFLRLWQHAPQWDPYGTASVKTWVSRVTTNLCLDIRRKRRQISLDEIDEPTDPAMGPLDALKQSNQKQILQQCLIFLPERQCAAIILSYFEDMKDQEVAEIMNTTVGAVESLLVRGRQTLRDNMKRLGLRWGEDF